MTGMLTVEQVADLLFVSRRTVWRLVEKGQFPQPVRFNRKLVRWDRFTVENFINDQNKDKK